MNANQLADAIEPLVLTSFHETQYIGRQAATLLRRQHEAIVKLREALEHAVAWNDDAQPCPSWVADAEQALKDTEELK